MSLVFTYDGSTLAADIPPTKVTLPQRAELGTISMGGISPEDPAASLALVGHRPFHVDETDCSQPRLFTGWVTTRNIGRSLEQGQFVGPDARIHDTTIVDLNACFGFRIITGADGNRPTEELSARVAWILGSAYLSGLVDDTGKVHAYFGATEPMDAADYRGQYPDAVLSDCNDRTGGWLNYFAFWDPAPDSGVARPGLFLDSVDEAVSTLCAISISNVLADIDGATVFAPETEARLERTPEEVYSDVILDYAGGSVFRTLASTETAHIKRGTSISRPHTGQASTATAQADNYLGAHANEVDRITATIHVPSSVVGLLWAGQRMDVRFSHLPGYTAYTSMRIVASTPRPVDDLADWYDVDLELVSPRVAAVLGTPASSVTDDVYVDHSSMGYGGKRIAYAAASQWMTPEVAPGRHYVIDWSFTHAVAGDGTDGQLSLARGVAYTVAADAYIADNVWASDLFLPLGSWSGSTDFYAIAGVAPFVGAVAGTAYPVTTKAWISAGASAELGYGTLHVGDLGITGGTIPPKPGETTVATTNPTVTEDSDHGYVTGVHWVNRTTGEDFVLVDSTVGAAVWTSTTTSGLTVDDEGTPLATAATTLDFVGAGVVASGTGTTKTITISGASAADIIDLPTAEMDDALVLAPDGAGGVEFRAEAGGGGGDVTGQLVALFDAGTSSLTAGAIAYIVAPYSGTITDWRCIGNATGNAEFDVAEVAAGGALPAFPADSIVAAAPPSMTGAVQAASSSVGTWTLAVTAGHLYAFKLAAVSGLSWASLTLNCSRP